MWTMVTYFLARHFAPDIRRGLNFLYLYKPFSLAFSHIISLAVFTRGGKDRRFALLANTRSKYFTKKKEKGNTEESVMQGDRVLMT